VEGVGDGACDKDLLLVIGELGGDDSEDEAEDMVELVDLSEGAVEAVELDLDKGRGPWRGELLKLEPRLLVVLFGGVRVRLAKSGGGIKSSSITSHGVGIGGKGRA
jgi:hypothetical protein